MLQSIAAVLIQDCRWWVLEVRSPEGSRGVVRVHACCCQGPVLSSSLAQPQHAIIYHLKGSAARNVVFSQGFRGWSTVSLLGKPTLHTNICPYMPATAFFCVVYLHSGFTYLHSEGGGHVCIANAHQRFGSVMLLILSSKLVPRDHCPSILPRPGRIMQRAREMCAVKCRLRRRSAKSRLTE
jgi:hypothetical protein